MSKRAREPWFAVGRPLSSGRSRRLLLCSFLLPLVLWCLLAYLPIWSSEFKISLTSDADSADFPAVYVVGDQMEAERFGAFQQAVRDDNAEVLAAEAAEAAEAAPDAGGASIRRANKRILRGIYPLAAREGWLGAGQEKDYAALYEIWKGIAGGDLKGDLSAENRAVVEANWALLAATSASYDSSKFYSQPCKSWCRRPEREVKRPVFLPAPHQVLAKAREDFSGNSELGELDIWSRYGVSLRTVFVGFLLVCAVGIPIALLCGTFSFFSRLIEPFVDFFRYMPAPAFGTLLIALFGIYDAPKVALVFVGTLRSSS